jgi:hypothetical protein
MSRVFVVVDHVEVEPNNWSTEVVKVFSTFDKAHEFAQKLKSYAEDNETVEIEEVDYE